MVEADGHARVLPDNTFCRTKSSIIICAVQVFLGLLDQHNSTSFIASLKLQSREIPNKNHQDSTISVSSC